MPQTRSILWINPVGTSAFDEPIREYLEAFRDGDTCLEVVSLAKGPSDLNQLSDEASVVPAVVDIVRKSAFDAAIVGCFNDTGLHESREISDSLIVGPGESAHHLASRFGSRWAVLVSDRKCIPRMTSVANRYGFDRSRVSFHSVGIPVHEFQANRGQTLHILKEVAERAIEDELAESIVLGCTIQFGMFRVLQDALRVPVIDVAVAALKEAEAQVDLHRRTGWRHSSILTYARPGSRTGASATVGSVDSLPSQQKTEGGFHGGV